MGLTISNGRNLAIANFHVQALARMWATSAMTFPSGNGVHNMCVGTIGLMTNAHTIVSVRIHHHIHQQHVMTRVVLLCIIAGLVEPDSASVLAARGMLEAMCGM